MHPVGCPQGAVAAVRMLCCARCGEVLGRRLARSVLAAGSRVPIRGPARLQCPKCKFVGRYFPLVPQPPLAA